MLATAFRGVKAWKNCSVVALKHLWAASRNQPQHDTGAQVLLVRRQASFNKVLLKLRSSLLQGWKQPKSNLLEGRWARPDKHLGSSTFSDEVLHIDPPNLMEICAIQVGDAIPKYFSSRKSKLLQERPWLLQLRILRFGDCVLVY